MGLCAVEHTYSIPVFSTLLVLRAEKSFFQLFMHINMDSQTFLKPYNILFQCHSNMCVSHWAEQVKK